MSGPPVTLGVPVYRGGDILAALLECLRTQSYANIEVLISVDGADVASAEAARPFLRDRRFRMHMQPTRLGWAGNTDWTIWNRRGEFWIYMQHDDAISPTYVEDLVRAATRHPEAAVCFSEMAVSGTANLSVRPEQLLGDPLARALTYMEKLESGQFRGLIRGSALDTTSGLRTDEYESFGAFYFLMTELALAGESRFVEGPIYYKRLDGKNMHLRWYEWPEEHKRAAWASLAAGEFEIIVPAGASVEARWGLVEAILERFLYPRQGRWTFCAMDKGDAAGRADMLQRIVERVRNAGRFGPSRELGVGWDTLAARVAERFEVPRPPGSR